MIFIIDNNNKEYILKIINNKLIKYDNNTSVVNKSQIHIGDDFIYKMFNYLDRMVIFIKNRVYYNKENNIIVNSYSFNCYKKIFQPTCFEVYNNKNQFEKVFVNIYSKNISYIRRCTTSKFNMDYNYKFYL